MNKLDLGKRIREARQSKSYTRHMLAEKSGIGEVYLGEIERGIKMPSLNSFIRIIETLEVSADYVLRDEVTAGQLFIFDELTEKLKCLSPQQRRTASEILDAYIRNL